MEERHSSASHSDNNEDFRKGSLVIHSVDCFQKQNKQKLSCKDCCNLIALKLNTLCKETPQLTTQHTKQKTHTQTPLLQCVK